MIDFLKIHKIPAIIFGVVLIALLWYFMTQTSSAPSSNITTTTAPTAGDDSDLVKTLLTLQAVTLDGTVLNDPGFVQLKDFTTQIVQEPIGRSNPFAPYSADTPHSASTTPAGLFAPVKKK